MCQGLFCWCCHICQGDNTWSSRGHAQVLNGESSPKPLPNGLYLLTCYRAFQHHACTHKERKNKRSHPARPQLSHPMVCVLSINVTEKVGLFYLIDLLNTLIKLLLNLLKRLTYPNKAVSKRNINKVEQSCTQSI